MARGYFPKELPFEFSTKDYAAKASAIAGEWNGAKIEATRPSRYSMARKQFYRRLLSIPAPHPFYATSQLVAENWGVVSEFLDQSPWSASKSSFQEGSDRAISITPFDQLAAQRLNAIKAYPIVLQTDTNNFYSSIYTHSIPWSLHGKDTAKKNKGDKALLGNKLDSAIRRGQHDETTGIAIGPDTSQVIAEIVATGVDLNFLKMSSNFRFSAHRFMDDFIVGCNSYEDAERLLSNYARALLEFNLKINETKTRVCSSIDYQEAIWPTKIRDFMPPDQRIWMPIGSGIAADRLIAFFTESWQIANASAEDSVMKFAVRMAASTQISKDTWGVFEELLLRTARFFTSSVDYVAKVLVHYYLSGYPLNAVAVSRLVSDLVRIHSPRGEASEVAWALWLVKHVGLKISSDLIGIVLRDRSCIASIIALDLLESGRVEGSLDIGFVKDFLSQESLLFGNWLLAYESAYQGWIVGDVSAISGDAAFGPLLAKNVSFYRRSVPELALELSAWLRKLYTRGSAEPEGDDDY